MCVCVCACTHAYSWVHTCQSVIKDTCKCACTHTSMYGHADYMYTRASLVAQSVKNLQVEGTASIQEWHDSFSESLRAGRQGHQGRRDGRLWASLGGFQVEAVRGRDLCWREEEWMRTEEPGERTAPVKGNSGRRGGLRRERARREGSHW